MELARARRDLLREGPAVLAVQADVTQRADVERLVAEVVARFGRIDVLVNDAGQIEVGPLATNGPEDFARAMDVMFWGVLHPTLAVLPGMRARGQGRIVNVTSIGGKVSLPHLLPYGCAKFAAVGLSEGLRAELASSGVRVTTIVPGLMRTGSYLNAVFKGRQEAEYGWFALGAALPGLSMSAERAARAIVRATARGEAERILTLPAKLATWMHGLFPGTTADVLGVVNRVALPGAEDRGRARGEDIEARVRAPWLRALTALGRAAAARFHERRPADAGASSRDPMPA
jgi:NAD(P)-dependent dehydrogenase (short-subunit alcohol dehydrogenase family)